MAPSKDSTHIHEIVVVGQQRPATFLRILKDARIVCAGQPFVRNPPDVPTPVLKEPDGRLLDIFVGEQVHQAKAG